jgi:predicted phosphoribosyltransferase
MKGRGGERFANREDAGRTLATQLAGYRQRPDVIVLGLPRGGVPVAREVAVALQAPLDVFVVRKLGTPGHRELAMGAIASGGVRVLNDDVIRALQVPAHVIESVAAEEQQELLRRERLYRDDRPLTGPAERIVIVVDDGLATGSTMKAAVQALRSLKPRRVVVAVPVGPGDTCRELASLADEVVCAVIPESFAAVGEWYDDFEQTTDEEVKKALQDTSAHGTSVAIPDSKGE